MTSVQGHAVQHVLMFQVLTMIMIKMMTPKIMPITKMAPCQIEISDAVGQGGGISLVPRRQSQHVARGHLGHSHILMFTNKCILTQEYFEQMVFGPSVIIWRCTNLETFDTLSYHLLETSLLYTLLTQMFLCCKIVRPEPQAAFQGSWQGPMINYPQKSLSSCAFRKSLILGSVN